MSIYKGVNLLPKVKTKEIKKYSSITKKMVLYLFWLLIIIIVNVISYIPVSLEKVQLLNLDKRRKQIIADLQQDQKKYILYHNIVFRLQIIENLQKSRFYLSKLVDVVDNTVYPSVAGQYTIHKDGTVSIGLSTDTFTKASISWHKLLTQKQVFKTLNLSSFSNQNEKIPFILKGQINLDTIKQDDTTHTK